MPRFSFKVLILVALCIAAGDAIAAKGAGAFQVFLVDTSILPTPNEYIVNGQLTSDDEVVLSMIDINVAETYRFRSLGYGGGSLPGGAVVSPGGFDTILTLFKDDLLLAQNDDASFAEFDPATSAAFDAGFDIFLEPGLYTLAITQYDNFAISDNLNDLFSREGEGNFTPSLANDSALPGSLCLATSFCDVSGVEGPNARTANYIVSVTVVPLPGALFLMLSVLVALSRFARVKRR